MSDKIAEKAVAVMSPVEIGAYNAPAPAKAVPPAVIRADLPLPLADFVARVEQFAIANFKDAKRDQALFWGLKAPTILSSAVASVTALQGLTTLSAGLALLAAVCAGIDLIYPRAQLRNAHWSAVHKLRTLEHDLADEWEIAVLRGVANEKAQADLLEKAMARRDDIATTVRDAEASLGAVAPAAEKR
jgi:hypothetical protein